MAGFAPEAGFPGAIGTVFAAMLVQRQKTFFRRVP
jgi:hypothetical protein